MDGIKNVGQNSDSMLKLTPELYHDQSLNDKEKTVLFLLKLKIFAVEDIDIYKNLVRKGLVDKIPDHCNVLGKHVFLYHGISKSIYMN